MKLLSVLLLLSCIICLTHCLNLKDKQVASIFMKFDHELPTFESFVSTPIPPARNTTKKYRDMIDYYGEWYGFDFNNGNIMLPRGAGMLIRYAVDYDIYAADIPGFFPTEGAGMTDVIVHDDVFMVNFFTDALVYGKYGGPNGTVVKAGSYLLYGYYTYTWKANDTAIFPPTKYFAPMPMVLEDGKMEIACMLVSPVFGNGWSKGWSNNILTPSGTILFMSRNVQMFYAGPAERPCRRLTKKRAYLPQDDDLALKWNDVFLTIVRENPVAPPRMARAGAMFHSAIHDAARACSKGRCSMDTLKAGLSYAAHSVLATIFPNQQACADDALFAVLEDLDQSEVPAGRRIGLQKAQAVISDRTGDGSTTPVDFVPSTASNAWIPTPPPNPRTPDLPQWPGVDTFGISDPQSYLVPPPMPGDADFESAVAEVKAKGERDVSTRTPDEEIMARFWADGPGTSTPPGHINMVGKHVLRQTGQNNNIFRNAVFFKMINYAVADAGIVAWTFKMTYKTIRPVSVVTQRYPNIRWRSLLNTPTHPDYVSGHSTFSAAGTQMISRLLGTNSISFQADSDNMDLRYLPRTFTNITGVAEESGKSRIYGGIHFEFANVAGKNAGRQIADEIFARLCKNRSCMSKYEGNDNDNDD